jgi:hypothetical protein
MDQTYPSKIDIWLILVLVMALALPIVLSLFMFQSNPREALITLATPVFTFGLCALLLIPCTYTLRDDHVLIRSGITRYRVFYKDITSVEKSSSMWSAPALSLQRVKLSLDHRFYLISPKNREDFIQALQKRISTARG